MYGNEIMYIWIVFNESPFNSSEHSEAETIKLYKIIKDFN